MHGEALQHFRSRKPVLQKLRRKLDETLGEGESATRIARAQAAEIEELRSRMRRAAEDRGDADHREVDGDHLPRREPVLELIDTLIGAQVEEPACVHQVLRLDVVARLVVSLAEVCRLDSSVLQLADLPLGWVANRASSGAEAME